MPGDVLVRGPQGDTTTIPVDKLTFWLDRGYTPISEDEYHQSLEADANKPDSSLGGAFVAGLSSAGAGATLGLSDVLLKGLETKGQLDYIAQQRQQHSGLSTAANIVGTVAPAFLTGGASEGVSGVEAGADLAGHSFLPATRAAEAGSQIKAALGGGLIGNVGEGAAVGAMQSTGNYVSDVALGDRDASAEEFLSEVGNGAKWGGIAGGALTAVEHGGIAAKRLFARADLGDKSVAELAQRDAAGKVGSIVDAGDEAVQASRDYAAKIRGGAQQTAAGADEAVTAMRADQALQQAHTGAAIDAVDQGGVGAAALPIKQTLAHDGMLADVAADAAHDAAAAHVASAGEAAELHAQQVEQLAQDVERRGAAVRDLMAEDGHAAVLDQTPDDLSPAAAEPKQPETIDEIFARMKSEHAVPDEPPTPHPWEVPGFGGDGGKSERSIADLLASGAPPVERDIVGRSAEALRKDSYTTMLRTGKIGPPALADVKAGVMEPGGFQPWNKPGPWWPKAPLAEQLDKTIEVVGGYEKSLADLNRMLGIDAPPAVQRIGQAYDAAVAEAESKGARGAAAAIDDSHATPTGLDHGEVSDQMRELADLRAEMANLPKRSKAMDGGIETDRGALHDPAAPGRRRPSIETERPIPLSTADDGGALDNPHRASGEPVFDPAAPGRRLPLRKGERRLGLSEHTGDAALDNPMREGQVKPGKLTAAAAKSGAFGKLTTVGKLLEGARALGIPGVPAIAGIPVVGPMLSIVLKAKIMKSLLGGSRDLIPETIEARVAAHAASTRDKIASAVDAALKGITAARPIAERLAPTAAAALAHRAFDGTTPNAKSDADIRTLAAERAEQLAQSNATPDDVARALRNLVPTADPDLSDSIVATVQRKLAYQAAQAPAIPPPDPLNRKPPPISTAEAMRFAGVIRATEHPLSLLDDLRDGTLTSASCEAVQSCYPKLYASIQQRVLERAAKSGDEVPYRTRVRLGVLFHADLDPSLTNVSALQKSAPPAATPTTPMPGAGPGGQPGGMPAAPPAPSVSGAPNLAASYQTSASKLATM